MNEFQFIEKYLSSKKKGKKFSLSFKDDVGYANNSIFSTDTICEGVHFFSNDNPSLIAKKLIRVNVSDIISKGINPKYCLLNLSIGKNVDEIWIKKFMKGFDSDLELFNLNLIGGDTSKTLQTTVLSLTIFGNLNNKKFIKRSSSKINDNIYVTGTIGDSSLGLFCKKNKIDAPKKHIKYLIDRFSVPIPRIELVSFINKNASASTDISDGLYSDLNNICKSSGVGAKVEFSKLPLSEAALSVLKKKPNLKKLILIGGDDYEILFTGPNGLDKKKNITKIGKITKEKEINIVDFDDRINLDGYKHEI